MTLAHSPLGDIHRSLGAKLVPFGGWEMPLSYPLGTLGEHRACRHSAAIFDVSHLGTVTVEGPDSFDRLQSVLTNDLRKISPGRAQYTHLLDADGSVLDDLIVWWVAEERFDVMPNASNTERVVAALGGRDVTRTRAVLAVQGPEARSRLASFAPDAAAIGRFRVAPVEILGVACTVAGTGYTGEDGVELAVPAAIATQVWEAAVAAGITPAGLGARDTLRLEAGLPLHGHELGPGVTPLQAGLGWVLGWDKATFQGRDAVAEERKVGPARLLRGVALDGRRPPRAGQSVLVDGAARGTVTSGNFSPTLERGIALAFLDPEVAVGTPVAVDLRGVAAPGAVVATPFVTAAPAA